MSVTTDRRSDLEINNLEFVQVQLKVNDEKISQCTFKYYDMWADLETSFEMPSYDTCIGSIIVQSGFIDNQLDSISLKVKNSLT